MFTDSEEEVAKGPGGAKGDPLVKRLTVLCRRRDEPDKKITRCIGAENGCTHTAAMPRNKIRIFNHAADCEHLPKGLREEINASMAKDAPSVKLANIQSQLNDIPPPAKRLRLDEYMSTSSQSLSPSSTLRPTTSTQRSVAPAARKAKQAEIKAQLDFDTVKLFCVGGIPINKVNLPEWKALLQHANPLYEPMSASTLEDSLIPREASRVRTLALEYLRTCENLSITFDGNTTRMPQSIYTIHVTTADRRVFLFEGNEASEDSHTADHLFAAVKEASI
jgi:hypothetical protein